MRSLLGASLALTSALCLDAVDRRTAWISGGSVSGGSGSLWRTTDGGGTWQDVSPPDSEGLMFRDVEARSADTAVVLAIGPGAASRVYRTADGGQTWSETFRNGEGAAFYNCLDFFPEVSAASLSAIPSTASSGSSARATAAGRGRCCPTRACRTRPVSSTSRPAATAS